jgi:hypothetical protein
MYQLRNSKLSIMPGKLLSLYQEDIPLVFLIVKKLNV